MIKYCWSIWVTNVFINVADILGCKNPADCHLVGIFEKKLLSELPYDKFVDRGPENKNVTFEYFILLKVIQVSQGNIKICREDGRQT